MEGLFFIVGVFLALYSYFVGCYLVASKEFRIYEGKRTVKLMVAAWLILWGLWAVIDRQ